MTQSSKSLPHLLAVLHLPPLPGSPGVPHDSAFRVMQGVMKTAFKEADELMKAGVHGLVLENYGDVPFYKDHVPSETVAACAALGVQLRSRYPKAWLGLNLLRNASLDAMKTAAVLGFDFIRVNVLSGAAVTDQGEIEGNAALVLRERARLHAPVQIWADILVKHSLPIYPSTVESSIHDLSQRGGADAIIVTGDRTGALMDLSQLKKAGNLASEAGVPLVLGSGATPESLADIAPHVQAIIVGSTLRRGGYAGEPLDKKRLMKFMSAYKALARPVKKTRAIR